MFTGTYIDNLTKFVWHDLTVVNLVSALIYLVDIMYLMFIEH